MSANNQGKINSFFAGISEKYRKEVSEGVGTVDLNNNEKLGSSAFFHLNQVRRILATKFRHYHLAEVTK